MAVFIRNATKFHFQYRINIIYELLVLTIFVVSGHPSSTPFSKQKITVVPTGRNIRAQNTKVAVQKSVRQEKCAV
jgi:hypothetical protein